MTATVSLRDEISGGMTGSCLFPFLSGMATPRLKGAHKQVAVLEMASPVEKKNSTCQATEVFFSRWETGFTPRTDLGKRLYELRTKAISAGMKLLSEDEVLEEIRRRRGETEHDDKNIY